MKHEKSIQISRDLFLKLIFYFVFDEHENHSEIKKLLEDKLDKVVKHELYSQYKNKNLSDTEREEARKKYLDMIGMRASFRW